MTMPNPEDATVDRGHRTGDGPRAQAIRVRIWVACTVLVGVLLMVVPDFSGCAAPTAHWVVLEPLAELLGVKQHFREDGVFGPWIGLVGLGVVPGLLAVAWAFRANAHARDHSHGRGEALLVGASGSWLVIACAWAVWMWPG